MLLVVLFLILMSSFASAIEKDCIYYFHGEGDSKSEATGIFLGNLQSKYTGLQIHDFEIYYDKANLELLQDYFDAYGVPKEKQGVPIVFLPQSYFVGDRSITEYIENAIISNKNLLCPSLIQHGVLGVIGEKSPQHLIETLTFFTITSAAIVDSVDASALAVLLILLGLLLIMEKKKRIMYGGASFITSVFLIYFLLGVGVLGTFARSSYFYKTVSGLAIVLGLTIIWYLWKGKIFLREIKENKKWGKFIRKMASPATTFLIGFVISLLSFSSSRKYFLVISNLLAEETTGWVAMPLLLYYNVLFILPLIALSLLFYWGADKIKEDKESPKPAGKWNIKVLHLIAGLFMFVLGIFILFLL